MASHALPRVHGPRRRLRRPVLLTSWWRGAALDEALAAGADPASDPRLAAHAARLRRAPQVAALAEAIERALRAAERPRPTMSPAVPVCAREVLAAYDDLLALAALLRTAPEPPVRALALARRLLLDGAGPLFNPETADTLGGAVREVLLAFDADHETYPPPV